MPIGRVVDNLIVYLLDDDLRPVRRGERGEIFMTGPSVCNSYIGGGQGKFFASPFVDRLGSEHAVMHRVGDLASLDNGLLYAHGRRDRVIKVRGHKVNLDAYTITLREESAAFGGSGGASRPSESIVFADRHFVETKILAFVYYAGVEHKVVFADQGANTRYQLETFNRWHRWRRSEQTFWRVGFARSCPHWLCRVWSRRPRLCREPRRARLIALRF